MRELPAVMVISYILIGIWVTQIYVFIKTQGEVDSWFKSFICINLPSN